MNDHIEIHCEPATDYMTGNRMLAATVSYLAWGVISFIILHLMWAASVLLERILVQYIIVDTAHAVSRYLCAVLCAIFILRLSNQPCFEYGWRADCDCLTILRPFHILTVDWNSISSVKLACENWHLRLWFEDSIPGTVESSSGILHVIKKIFSFSELRRLDVNMSNISTTSINKSILLQLRKLGKADNIRAVNGVLVDNPDNEPDIEQFDCSPAYVSVADIPEMSADRSFGQLRGWAKNLIILCLTGIVLGYICYRIALLLEANLLAQCVFFSIGYSLAIYLTTVTADCLKIDANAIILETPLLLRKITWDYIEQISVEHNQSQVIVRIFLPNGKCIECCIIDPVLEYAICGYALHYRKAEELSLSKYAVSIFTPIPDKIPDEITWKDCECPVLYSLDQEGIHIKPMESEAKEFTVFWRNVRNVELDDWGISGELLIESEKDSFTLPYYISNISKTPQTDIPETTKSQRQCNLGILAAIKHIRKANPDISIYFPLELLESI